MPWPTSGHQATARATWRCQSREGGCDLSGEDLGLQGCCSAVSRNLQLIATCKVRGCLCVQYCCFADPRLHAFHSALHHIPACTSCVRRCLLVHRLGAQSPSCLVAARCGWGPRSLQPVLWRGSHCQRQGASRLALAGRPGGRWPQYTLQVLHTGTCSCATSCWSGCLRGQPQATQPQARPLYLLETGLLPPPQTQLLVLSAGLTLQLLQQGPCASRSLTSAAHAHVQALMSSKRRCRHCGACCGR